MQSLWFFLTVYARKLVLRPECSLSGTTNTSKYKYKVFITTRTARKLALLVLLIPSVQVSVAYIFCLASGGATSGGANLLVGR